MLNSEKLNSIEELAATIAHEVKNPLSLVKANIELLESADVLKTYSKNYNVIKKELNKINEMMMDFLQLTTVSKYVENEIVYIYDIFISIIESYSISMEGNLKFKIECENTDIHIFGCEKDLTKVFQNLIKNSVEAIGNKVGKVFIIICQDKEKVLINIKDNGTGICSTVKDKMEDNFFTTKPYGNGLGIPICKKIVKEHKGEISFENNEFGGCTVFVCFHRDQI